MAETAAAAMKKSDDKVDNTAFLKSVNDTIARLEKEGKIDEYMQQALELAQ